MTAHTDVATHTSATYAISAGLPATYDAAGYAATTITYTSIGKMAKFPTYGSRRAVTNFPMISEGIAKIKGAADYGGGDLMMADVPADAGQVILKAAEASSNHYSLKITYADGEVHYMDAVGVRARVDLAREMRIGGVVFWAMGFDTPDTWTSVADVARPRTTTP